MNQHAVLTRVAGRRSGRYGRLGGLLAAALLGMAPGRTGEAAGGGAAPGVDAGVVVAWNELAYVIAYGEDQFLTFKGQRALAMMNLAMHDALNTISPVYDRYTYAGDPGRAEPEVAAAQAAYEVLSSEYPGTAARLDSALAESLSRSGAEPGAMEARSAAVDLGRAAAEAVLGARREDGWDTPGTYDYASGPGRYRTTPGWDGFVLQPGFGGARPFVIPSVDPFRPPPPPGLTSAEYARAYDEVKAYGAAESADRPADQTAYAVWWMEFAEGSVARLARRLVMEQEIGLWEAARLFAHLHVALYDAYVVTWESKYAYDHWRPYTAIRSAADDGNADTSPDPGWESLRPAPPFPEYVSAHAAGCAAAFTVLADAFGDETRFTMTTITAPDDMPERSFASFRAAAAECADSRIRLGWHFRYSTDAGLALGERVAAHVLGSGLGPR